MKYIFVILITIFLISGLIACKSGDKSKSSSLFTTISVKELHDSLPNKDFLLANVHIPYQGEIPKTDLFVPYNEIERNIGKLPDKSAKIVLYCRSGSMSNTAANILVKLGYENIIDVPGGMIGWEASGYDLTHRE